MPIRHAVIILSWVMAWALMSIHDAFAAKVVPTIRVEIPEEAVTTPKETPTVVPDLPEEDVPTLDSVPEAGESEENHESDEPAIVDETEEPQRPPVKVFYGDLDLPEKVKETRQRLLDVAVSGDINALKPIFDAFEEPPIVSLDPDGDPVDFLKQSSGDGEGVEVLAILMEVLESGYVHREEGTEAEIYVWPYFVETPLDRLTKPQLVELFHIITAGDYSDMKDYGAYIFYRVGITPDGELKYFVAGD